MVDRALHTAEILAVGSELTTGSTLDTNSRELAADLTRMGFGLMRVTLLPDRFAAVQDALAQAMRSVDLVVTTGGLGPTPDDLTREAISAALGLEPRVDPELLQWLEALFERRGMPMPETNRKQAWLVPGAVALPNANGTAPGWWVDRSDGGVIVALPGPPREMRPMWRDDVLLRLSARGAGREFATETLRLTGIGESRVAELVGDAVLRAADPEVATYARPDAVDLRISSSGAGARDRVADMLARLDALLGEYCFARGAETWIGALGARLAGRTLAVVEIGTAGQLGALLGEAPWLILAQAVAPASPLALASSDLRAAAMRVRDDAGADVGVAIRGRERRGDLSVAIAIAIGAGVHRATRTAFLAGALGRQRAALAAAAELWRRLGN